MRRLASVAVGVAAGLVLAVVPGAGGATAVTPYDGRLVAVVDQDTSDFSAARVRVMDPAVKDWSRAEAQKWEWHPTGENGFGELAAGWGAPSDVKLRRERGGRAVVLVTDSLGLAGVMSYPGGRRIWGVNLSSQPNLHSAELLPDGNVALAATRGGFVRVYSASQGSSSVSYAEFALPRAHGVQWDPVRKLLWALGDTTVVALKVGGTAAAPTLAPERTVALPSPGGHDLTPVLGDPDRLWISTTSFVYQFSKSTGKFMSTHDWPDVRSVGSTPRGQVVRTSPAPDCATSWCTDTVTFSGPDFTRTLPGAEIYKARVWSYRYL
ncbi:DUF6528 family protein [Kribbella sp. NPDC051770]|uniref:DUF6528 family protein n=1 Tax=Kribbella sp. NPDC051770 TaxID=3155413 RepID=UPI00342883FE